MSGACVRCQGALADDDLRCAVCALTTPFVAPDAGARANAVQIARCEGCGAAVKYVAEANAPKCIFCSAVMKLEVPSDPVEEAELFVPFAVPPDQALRALQGWLATLGWFRPKNLAREAKLETLRPLSWAAWMVDANATVTWAADSNYGSGRSPWAPHAGRSDLHFENLLVSASRGLREDETRRLARSFDLRTARPQPDTQIASILESFELQRSAARHHVVSAIETTAASRLQGRDIPGSSFRNVHVSVLLRDLRTRRVALPTYVLAYRFGKRHYRAIVHGQDASCVFGEAPLAWGKIALVVFAVLLVIAGIVLAVVLSH